VIHDNRHGFDVRVMCRLCGVSRQGYYDWARRARRTPSARSVRREQVVAAIRRSHAASRGRYGSPNVHRDLLEQGVACCVNTVAKRMKEHGIASTVRRKFRVTTTDSNHDRPVFANRLGRDFRAHAPDLKWAADITYVPTSEGFLYLAGVVDLYSRRVVGWCMKETLQADLCVEALEMALARRRPGAGLLHHSDRGCQYASGAYQDKLEAFGLRCSMSGAGNCWDNAVVESLWASLKAELIYQQKFATRQQARDAIFEWIEVWYNRRRRHSSLGYVSPEAFEAMRN
jgi:putative transposase